MRLAGCLVSLIYICLKIIPLRELKVEYKQFEAKIQLCNKFDLFLADDRIIRLLPQFLGKNFYKRKKIPLQINLRHRDLPAEFSRCLMTTQLPMKHAGSCSTVAVGHSEQELGHLVENTQSVVETLKTKYPGTFKNIRSVHINCGSSSLPLYVSLRNTEDLGLVTGKKRSLRPAVTDELSTVVGAQVSVSPFGNVKVKRKADPNWTEKDESLEKITDDVKANNEEDEESEKPETQDSPAKKKKKNEKSESKAKKPAEDESEDDDDDIEDQELEYMKKVAEEEEEMERKLEKDDQKLHAELEADKKGNTEEEAADSEEEEEELDDDAEADNLLSEGDDSEDEEDTIMMSKSLKDIQEEIEEDPPAPKKKSKKAEKAAVKKKGKKAAEKPVNKKEKKSQKFVEQKKKDKGKSKKK